jgi:hypothetical protein
VAGLWSALRMIGRLCSEILAAQCKEIQSMKTKI